LSTAPVGTKPYCDDNDHSNSQPGGVTISVNELSISRQAETRRQFVHDRLTQRETALDQVDERGRRRI